MNFLSYEKKDRVWLSLTIEVDLNVFELERTTYTYFDLLSDVGGLSSIVCTFFAMILRFWNHNSFDNMMAISLFKVKNLTPTYSDKASYMKESKTPYCKELLMSLLPSCCICCKLDREELALAKAREKLNFETNIIDIVRTWRYMKLALKHLLPKHTRDALMEESRYRLVDPKEDLFAPISDKNKNNVKVKPTEITSN